MHDLGNWLRNPTNVVTAYDACSQDDINLSKTTVSEVAFGGLFSKESLRVNIWTTVKISRVEKLKMVVEARPPPQKKRSLPSASQVVIVTDGANGAVLCRNRCGDFWISTVPMISYDRYHFLSLLTLLLDHYASAGCGFWQQVSDICWGGHEPHLAAMTAELWEWEWEALFEF